MVVLDLLLKQFEHLDLLVGQLLSLAAPGHVKRDIDGKEQEAEGGLTLSMPGTRSGE